MQEKTKRSKRKNMNVSNKTHGVKQSPSINGSKSLCTPSDDASVPW